MKKLHFGPSVGYKSSLLKTVQSVDYLCFQMELPSNYEISLNDKLATLEECVKTNKRFYFHLCLTHNLATSNYVLTSSKYHPTNSYTINTIQKDIDNLVGLPSAAILHIGKSTHGGSLETVIDNLSQLKLDYPRITDSVPKPLLLENAAGQKNELGVGIDEIRKLFEKIDTHHIGLCIDTQHSFASTLCDFGSPDSINNLFEELPVPINLIHLNDSKKIWGSRVDRHENLGHGYIFSSSERQYGLKYLFDICLEKSIDLVLETPQSKQNSDLESIKNWGY